MPRTGLTAEQLKEKAIDHALQHMRQVGFNKVRLSDIAKELGVSHAALYSHFADKSALFDAVCERWLVEFDAEQEKLCLEKSSGDALDRLTQWFVQLHKMKIAKVKNDPELFKALNFSTEVEKPFVQKHLSTMRRQLSVIVSQAMKAKLVADKNVDDIVTLLMEATMSFHHPAMVAMHGVNDREILLRQVLNTMYDGFAKGQKK